MRTLALGLLGGLALLAIPQPSLAWQAFVYDDSYPINTRRAYSYFWPYYSTYTAPGYGPRLHRWKKRTHRKAYVR